MFILICSFSPITSLISQFSFKRLKNPHWVFNVYLHSRASVHVNVIYSCEHAVYWKIKKKKEDILFFVYTFFTDKSMYTDWLIDLCLTLMLAVFQLHRGIDADRLIDIFVLNANVSSISAYWATSWRWCKQTHILYHVKIMSCNECTNRWYHIYYKKYLITCVHQ